MTKPEAKKAPETSARVPGHTLRKEGRGFNVAGQPEPFYAAKAPPYDRAMCSCGWLSGPLPSNHARRQSHRRHKAAVLAQGQQ